MITVASSQRCERCHNSEPPDTGCAACNPKRLGERLRDALADRDRLARELVAAKDIADRYAGQCDQLRKLSEASLSRAEASCAEIDRLARENAELRQANDLLKAVAERAGAERDAARAEVERLRAGILKMNRTEIEAEASKMLAEHDAKVKAEALRSAARHFREHMPLHVEDVDGDVVAELEQMAGDK